MAENVYESGGYLVAGGRTLASIDSLDRVDETIEHRWGVDDWDSFAKRIVTQDGSQSFTVSVESGYGRVTGTGADDGNQRELYLHRHAYWENGEVTAVFKGPSTYVSGNRPQMGVALRYQEIGGFHTAFVVWYDVFAGNPRVQNIGGWRGNGGETLNQASGDQYTAEIARDLRVLGVRRFDFLGTWINEYVCQPHHLHGLTSGDPVTVDVNDDTFDATAQAASNPDREKGTFQLSEATTQSAVTYKAADGTVVQASDHRRYFPYVLKARLVDDTISVKAWRGRYEPEPADWQSVVTVATDADFPTLPSGPGGFGIVAAHAHDDSYMEFGDLTFRKI